MCLGERCTLTAAAVQEEALRSAVRAVDFMVEMIFTGVLHVGVWSMLEVWW